MPQLRFDSRNMLPLHPQFASRQHTAESPIIVNLVCHLRPAARDPEFLRARRARVENNKIVAQPRLRDDLCSLCFHDCRQSEANLMRSIVHTKRCEQRKMMIDCVDEADLRWNELVITQLPERLATDGIICNPPMCT